MDHASLHLHLAKTPEKKHNKKSVTICTVTKDVKTIRLNSYICPHSFTPLRQRRKSHKDAVEVTLKKPTSFSSIRLRGVHSNGGKPEDAPKQYRDVRQYGRRPVYESGDVRFQDGDAFDLGKLGGGCLLSSSSNVIQYLHLR